MIHKLRRTTRFAYLFLRPGAAIMVPRRAFVHEDDFDTFYGMCQLYLHKTTLLQQATSGLKASATIPIRRRTTSYAGAAMLAVVGSLFMGCGGAVIILTLKAPSAPTVVSVVDLEKSSEAPPGPYLQITGGHLYWPEMYAETMQGLADKSATTRCYYVPLVSKDVIEEWMAMQGARVHYNKARVFLRISASSMRHDFAQAMEKPGAISQEKSPVYGSADRLTAIPAVMLDGMRSKTTDLDPDKMLVLHYGAEVPSKPTWVGVGVGMAAFSLPWFVPLGVVLRKRFKSSRPATALSGPSDTLAEPRH
jgi:hypothetical protein